jgi:hypothetical protein
VRERLRAAGSFALKHLGVSALIAALCAALVFGLWYPYPYSELASGRELFALVIAVDIVIGPLLSLVVYNPKKPRLKLWRDIGTVFVMQLAALGYGLYSVAQARPVLLAFEGDRFRIVAVPDIHAESLSKAPTNIEHLGWTGPRMIGVRLLDGRDPEFPKSIQLAMQGVHPAFRPDRWIDYENQRQQVARQAKPLPELKARRPESAPLIEDAVRSSGVSESELGYLPLHSQHRDDWIVVVSVKDGMPRAYLPVDGW